MWHASDVRHSCCMNEVNSHKPAIAGEGEVIIVTFLVLPSMYLDCSKWVSYMSCKVEMGISL